MDDGAGEAAGQRQVHGWTSCPLSFPSQPPDIKNWFSSYEYESPEVPELVADPAADNGSETQDPFEYPLSKHSARDGDVALRENCLGDQSEPEVFAGKYLVPVDKGIIKPAPKRKQSLRALFGDGFLDKDQEATENESWSLLPAQRNALEPLSDCKASLPDPKQSQEGSADSKLLVDCDGISSVDTQDSTPADQEVECSKQSVDCDDARLANFDIGEGFPEDVIHQVELPLKFNGANLAATEKNIQDGVEHSICPVSRNNFSLAETEENSPQEETQCCKLALDSKRPQEIVASDGFVVVKRKVQRPDECIMNKIPRHPMGREKEKGKLQENNGISEQVFVQEQIRRPFADRTNISEVAPTAAVQEVSKKWKCPRKGKPFVGRPMKQLRLERWVRRMN